MKLLQEKVVIGCGVWLIILPFTGFPRSWKTVLTILTGVVIAYVGALIFKKARKDSRHQGGERRTETFTETP